MGNTCLYGATGGRAVRRRHRGRALRGPQLRRARGRRGRRRSLLRVHDRRRRLRARPHRGELRRRLHRRLRLCARHGARFRRPLQPSSSSTSTACRPRAWARTCSICAASSSSTSTTPAALWGAQLLNDFRTYIGKFWVVKPKAAAIDSLLDEPAPRRLSARIGQPWPTRTCNSWRFRASDPEKLPVEVSVTRISRDLRAVRRRDRRRSRRAAACPAAIRSASGNARCTTTFRTGWRW